MKKLKMFINIKDKIHKNMSRIVYCRQKYHCKKTEIEKIKLKE